jgi:hypothetical protein
VHDLVSRVENSRDNQRRMQRFHGGAGLGNGGVCVIRLAAVAKSSTGG